MCIRDRSSSTRIFSVLLSIGRTSSPSTRPAPNWGCRSFSTSATGTATRPRPRACGISPVSYTHLKSRADGAGVVCTAWPACRGAWNRAFQICPTDKKRCCRKAAILRFKDRNTQGLRDGLYCKDDDGRPLFLKGSGIAGRASSVGLRRRRLRPSRTVKRFYALQKAVRSSRRADTRVCPAGYAETTAYALSLIHI